MSGTTILFASRRSRRILAVLLALLLPPLSLWCTQSSTSLQAIPFALDFMAITVVAALGGFLPALLALFIAIADRRVFVLFYPAASAPQQYDLVRSGVLLAAAALIAFTAGRRQRSERQLEAAIAELQDRTESLVASLNASRCASWTFNMDSGSSPRWYSGSYQVFGRDFEELEAMPSILPLVHPDDHPRLPQLIDPLRNNTDPLVFEYRCPWPNGELHTLEMRGTKVSQEPCVWRGITVDITERKLTEAALLRAEKLAAMGRLASTVAHEINNPLEAVTNLLYLARSDEAVSPLTQSYLNAAERELSRLSNITRLTLGFVRTSGSVADTSIAHIVDEVISIFQHRLQAENVIVQRDFQPNVRISIAPHELRQIATNLIANAADAIAHTGGRIHVTVASEGPHAIFCVEDNGSGIAPANLPRIFEPFFSTKEEIGTGIGLWVTRELVEKNSGTISAQSGDLPNGLQTRFRIEFPLAQD
jgi:signal transduction histidine kinase